MLRQFLVYKYVQNLILVVTVDIKCTMKVFTFSNTLIMLKNDIDINDKQLSTFTIKCSHWRMIYDEKKEVREVIIILLFVGTLIMTE